VINKTMMTRVSSRFLRVAIVVYVAGGGK
jgi:hypothetical protein